MSKYSQDKPPKVGEVLDCGDLLKAPTSLGTGYAWTPDGKCICYAHADALQLQHLEDLDTPLAVYLSEDRKSVKSWSGGVLGEVTDYATGGTYYSFWSGPWRMRYITVKTPGGRTWRGQGSDQYQVITLRRPRWMTKRGL